MSSPARGSEVGIDEIERHYRVEQFLSREADLLDRFKLDAWLDLVATDIELRVPVRTAQDPGAEESEFSDRANYLKEDYPMLRERVGRLNKEYAWSENPRSRIRHVLGNVQIVEGGDPSEDSDGDGKLVVTNNQHVYRSYGDTPEHDLLSASRETTLRPTEGSFKIADRTVYLDHSILNTRNLTLPLL